MRVGRSEVIVMRTEVGTQGRVRVIGALYGEQLQMLLDMIGGTDLELDFSEVHEADVDAVRRLALLPQERCSVFGCPKWLAHRIEAERTPLRLGAIA
jgi:hypothetical protein